MLAGRSRNGSPMRRTIRVFPTSGDRSTGDVGSAPDDTGPLAGGLDVVMGVAVDPLGDGVNEVGFDSVEIDGDRRWRPASTSGRGRGEARSVRSRAWSARTVTVGRSLDASGMRCASASERP